MKDVESCGSGLKPKDDSSEVRLRLADYHRFEGGQVSYPTREFGGIWSVDFGKSFPSG